VTVVEGEADDEADVFQPVMGEITGHDPATGEELWTLDGFPGFCDADEIAIGTSEDVVTLVDVRTGDEGESFATPGAGSIFSVPSGDHVVVTVFDFAAEDASVSAAVYPRVGGEATFEEDDAVAFPISDDLVLTASEEGDEVRLVRARDGEEVGAVDVPGDDEDEGSCTGALTLTTALFCETGSPDVTAHTVAEGFEERWTVDVGAGVVEATVGGDRLFAVTEDDELVALR
jgi:hypothetical protein